MHIELTEMLRCPEPHAEEAMVLSTGEMIGRMVRSGLVGCSVCRKEFLIVDGVVDFTGRGTGEGGRVGAEATSPVPPPASRISLPDYPQALQALLELSGPGGFVVLLGGAARRAVGLAGLMTGVHFIGINAPRDLEELPVLSLLRSDEKIPLRSAMARGLVVGADFATSPWLVEAHRVLLRGRRFVVEHERPDLPIGLEKLAAADGLWVGEKK
jgi:hypothetical protein